MSKVRFARVLAAVALLAAGPLAVANTYNLDGVHSSVAFRILHNGVNHVHGTFASPTGTVTLTDTGGSINVTVPVASVHTGNANRDNHLRSNDYFAAQQFPTVTFRADNLTRNADGTYTAEGQLTLRGVTRPLTVTLTVTDERPGARGGIVRGLETSFTIDRTQFGITSGAPAVGNDVTLHVSLQLVKQ